MSDESEMQRIRKLIEQHKATNYEAWWYKMQRANTWRPMPMDFDYIKAMEAKRAEATEE